MKWKDAELNTIGDLCRALENLTSKNEALEFMKLYRAESPYAYQNVGYLSGYFSSDKMAQIQDWCECSHPIFGKATNITPEEAVAMGAKIASMEH